MVLSLRPLTVKKLNAKSFLAYAADSTFLEEFKDHTIPSQHESPRVSMSELNSKLKQLAMSGDVDSARKLFDELPHRDEFSWTTMMSGYIRASDPSEALSLFYKMWVSQSVRMDRFVLSLAVKACGLNTDVNSGELLHGYSTKTGLVNSVFVGSAILSMYMKVGRVYEGCKIFDEMPLRNVVSWTTIITGLVHAGLSWLGLSFFSKMWKDGVDYDSHTYAIAIKACADLKCLSYGKEIHARTIKKGVETTSFVANSLSTMYNKCGKQSSGWCIFETMSRPDVVSWTSMITTHVQTGNDKHGIECFLKMREHGVCPNEYTYAAVIAGIGNISSLEWGQQSHAHVLKLGLADSLSVANSLMTMYSKCGHSDSASIIFHVLNKKDVISWSSLIAGYAQGGCGEEAFELLVRMRREGPKPTEYAISSVLSVCGTMALLDQGRQLHAYAFTIGLDQTSLIQSALINMYSKCGNVHEAAIIYAMSDVDDIVSWTAMLNGYAEHGKSQEAINLFERLRVAGLRPDAVTFIGVLSACSHAGLVDLGFRYFDSMTNTYNISPTKQHYGCMIDLLCRDGRLHDALNMIESMPFERDDVVWSTLLSASRKLGDVECARIAADRLLIIDPESAGMHITLANIYASSGKWREAAETRKRMKSKGIVKEPGWSWIEIKNRVSAFVAGDKSHPQCDGIYDILKLVASREELTVEELASIIYLLKGSF